MIRFMILALIFCLTSCAQDPYRLKVKNNLNNSHGQSVYFRSNLRSAYASQIRRTLSQKFGEMGLKTATSAENADYIAIFDIETFYAQDGDYKNTTFVNTQEDGVLFTDQEDANSLGFSGNGNMNVGHDQTCFTLNIGRKGTSNLSYESSFCSAETMETEDMLPRVLDIYGKYATYLQADVGVQCLNNMDNTQISCNPVHDRQQAFINSLWIDHEIAD